MRFWKQKGSIVAAAVLLVLLCAIGMRVALLGHQFGHADDLGVAATLAEARLHPQTSAHLAEEAREKEARGQGTPRTEAMLKLAANPAASAAIDALAAYPVAAVPMKWTYAPLPFLLTPALIGPQLDYAQAKLLGRIPSLLFAIATLLAVIPLSRRLAPEAFPATALIILATLALSREFVVMSAQMHPYAATVFVATALIWLTIHDAARPALALRWREIALRALLLVLAVYTSYQAILPVAAYLASLALRDVRLSDLSLAGLRRHLPRLAAAVTLGILVGIAFLPAYLFRVRTIQAVNWNAGPGGEFVFTPGGIGAGIVKAPLFLLHNGWLTAEAMLSPSDPAGWAAAIISLAILLCALAGAAIALRALVRCLRAGADWGPLPALATFLLALTGLTLLAVLAGKLPLAPTRHMLLFLPLIAVTAAIGARRLAARLQLSFDTAAIGIAAILLVAALTSFPALWQERTDRFDEKAMAMLVGKVRPDAVLTYGLTYQMGLMPSVRAIAPVIELSDLDPQPLPAGLHRVLLISHRGPVDPATCALLAKRLPDSRAISGNGCPVGTELHPLTAQDGVEIESSQLTRNGGNGLFIALARLP
ncbi:hypothetical protein P6144_19130 [Sphingomonas sp. HITSZ_GF]|uniref:hypothetical protein n=1 Tax=Sphingomonas sp. HITSZ_GF TaxID=3037247 RepID=UPI00240E968D|nr:hypothetical protein [Sphingomonas sp. HITSZ_GF]MDG2535783.1 hypothetical protein [Sphingomonas sp. HITSZ_GF]